ncbi:MAG: low temperature requirement protein A, partial [Chloroflexota bacterium]|nr:low temperature requirement protein A [Chloroflexota bacterium]
MTSMLRDRSADEAPAVTNMELFFDLVYVFAVTQLSHRLLTHLTLRGAVETLVLFLAVWWAWNYTAWATNWIDPDQPAVRGLLVVLMLLSLVMSVAIPEAFGATALSFAAAYVALQVVRSAFMVVALRGQRMGRNYAHLLAWTGIAGIVWVAGAFVPGDGRLLVWIAALALDYGAPLHGFALPGLGRTRMRDWTLAGGHLAERNQQVLLIALGESILAVGGTVGALPVTAAVALAFVVGFVVNVALWWVYFVRQAEEGERAIAQARDPARVGRAGYAYAHGIMVGGVIVVAVAIDLTLAHPTGPMSPAAASVILGGPALYLAGNALFNYALAGQVPWSRLLGIGLLALFVPLALVAAPLVLSTAAMLVTLT